jgi:predicted small metal-binding protein
MAKVLRCRDMGHGGDCSWEGRAETVDELMAQAAQHAKEAHGMAEIPPEMQQAASAIVRDE